MNCQPPATQAWLAVRQSCTPFGPDSCGVSTPPWGLLNFTSLWKRTLLHPSQELSAKALAPRPCCFPTEKIPSSSVHGALSINISPPQQLPQGYLTAKMVLLAWKRQHCFLTSKYLMCKQSNGACWPMPSYLGTCVFFGSKAKGILLPSVPCDSQAITTVISA